MKTPREILFERHRSANPKLDAVRRESVAAIAPSTGERQSGIGFLRDLFRFRPKAWMALAAAWVVIFALRVSTGDEPHGVGKRVAAAPSPGVLAELRQQKLLFVELVGTPDRRDPPPVKPPAPRPRSERRYQLLTA